LIPHGPYYAPFGPGLKAESRNNLVCGAIRFPACD
jgi:hypothetical protein